MLSRNPKVSGKGMKFDNVLSRKPEIAGKRMKFDGTGVEEVVLH